MADQLTSFLVYRSAAGAVAMMHITEDTPPDMLAGAMDLTVHLPTGRAVKMSVERRYVTTEKKKNFLTGQKLNIKVVAINFTSIKMKLKQHMNQCLRFR